VLHDWVGEDLVFELKSHPPLRQLGSFQQGLFYGIFEEFSGWVRQAAKSLLE
jgi:hypothetical protein